MILDDFEDGGKNQDLSTFDFLNSNLYYFLHLVCRNLLI